MRRIHYDLTNGKSPEITPPNSPAPHTVTMDKNQRCYIAVSKYVSHSFQKTKICYFCIETKSNILKVLTSRQMLSYYQVPTHEEKMSFQVRNHRNCTINSVKKKLTWKNSIKKLSQLSTNRESGLWIFARQPQVEFHKLINNEKSESNSMIILSHRNT